MYMPYLEPNVGMRQGAWRVAKDLMETVEGIGVLALLLVYYAEAEENLVGLVEV